MPRKKRKSTNTLPVDAIWCFYCDRTFKDESTLVTHQKAKHYRCSACNKKMNTAQGLQVHCEQVHKIKLTGVPGAKEGRENMQIEIFGMAGIPSDVYQGGPPELFRKATKRQVIYGATLMDEKGNLLPNTPSAQPLVQPPMMVPPPISPPPKPLFQSLQNFQSCWMHDCRPGTVPTGGQVTPVQTPTQGGLVASAQGAVVQGSGPLLFPQGVSYAPIPSGRSQSEIPLPQQPDASMHHPTFVFHQTIVMPGQTTTRLLWRNEEQSMEEVRAKCVKYASPHNVA